MQDYRSPVEEIVFALEQGAEAARLPDWDRALAQEVLAHAASLVDGEIAPLDQIADQQSARLEAGQVVLPDAFVDAYEHYVAGGWSGLTADPAYGGQGLPEVLGISLQEALSGACVSFQMLLSLGQGAMRALLAHGSEQQRATYLPKLVSGEWLATMCMTEPGAGSDLGLLRTSARPDLDGRWRLQGEKVFITGGGQNLTDNIVHLVLARTEGAPAGVKGLSLFICRNRQADGQGNNISVSRLEEKMGLHASPTCQLHFDGAEAELLGDLGQGLACMFTMMNAERLDVAAQGVGLAEVATQRSWAYARDRRQGRAANSDSAADPICRHADVQRMLLEQKALTLGARAMLYRTAVDLQRNSQAPLATWMTPVCKVFCSEAGVRAADLAIQIHGGYGYCREYRVEQVLRDARITTIYEGTNGIQSMTLSGRLLQLAEGACVKAFQEEVLGALELVTCSGDKAANELREALEKTLGHWQRATRQVEGSADPGGVAVAYMRLTGLTAFGAAWARLLVGADQAAQPALIRGLAVYVAKRLLPESGLLCDLVVGGSQEPAWDSSLFDAAQ